jgi:hypothetical protein
LRKQALIIAAFVVLLRLPFLNQAIQGDDFYYLAAAQWAQIDPAHPHHAKYVFLGVPMDMRGHPHPPGNAWLLAGLLAAVGDVTEIPFHAAYLGLSLIAALSMLSLARRFVPQRALEATLLFCAVPPFLVNGNSLESDLPFLAFWMLSFALALSGRMVAAALAIAACSLMAYQSVALIPILGWWLYRQGELKRQGWVLAVPLVVIGGWLLFERLAVGATPVEVLNQHFQTYGLQRFEAKLKSAAALCGHLVVMFTPLGLWALLRRRHWFLSVWAGIFFAAALALFFAGSARYLLPLSAPFALIVALHYADRPRWIWTIFALQLALGLGLAWINFDHWQGYRRFVADARNITPGHRVWVNGEWGLRHYAESDGALPVVRGQVLRPGDYLIDSALAERIPFTTGGGQLVQQARAEITPALPLRIIGLGVKSGYSSTGFGLRPFDVAFTPVDVLTLSVIVEKAPELTWLPMTAPQTEWQTVSGVYTLENGQWRWMGPRAVFLLKSPAEPAPAAADIYIPDMATGRTVTLEVDGKEVARQAVEPGRTYRLASAAFRPANAVATLTLTIDKEFKAPGDDRRLGMIVTAAGFAPPQ